MTQPGQCEPIDLSAVTGGDSSGVIWSLVSPDLNVNLVELVPGGGIGPHVNGEVDVFVHVLTGAISAAVDGQTYEMGPGSVLLLPRGSERALGAGAAGARYVTVHRRRGALKVGRARPRK